MKLTLRGHHLLCLKGFQGFGYDEKFTQNMININHNRKLDTTKIKLTDKADDICKACPNLKNNLCKNELDNQRIINMDNEVLKNFNTEKEYNSKELFEKIDDIFKDKKSLSKICLNCSWHDKCLFYQKF